MGWEHLTEEEKLENPDYINELRFGGDPRSDDEIKQAIYEMSEEEFDQWANQTGDS